MMPDRLLRNFLARPERSWALLLAVPATWVWVHARPHVVAVSDAGEGVYRPGAAALVFGADVTFAMVAVSVALVCIAGTLVLTRGAALGVGRIAVGAVTQLAAALIMVAAAPVVESTHVRGKFPPAHIAVGSMVSEPARVHALGLIAAGALTWLIACGLSAGLLRQPTNTTPTALS